MKHILIADDDLINLTLAKAALSKNFMITGVTSGRQAIESLKNNKYDLILLDISMPELDGFEVMKKIRENTKLADIPIIFLTADNNPQTESHCLQAGAADFIKKPFVQDVMLSRINNIIELHDLKNNLAEKLEERTRHIRYIQDMMVLGLAVMVESRDNSTGGHIKRTSAVVAIFAKKLLQMGIFPQKTFLEKVIRAAPMHDLGKIAVDDAVLKKQGKFTDEEYAKMKKHSEEGARIVKQILNGVEEEEFVKIAVNVAHFHHEKWNGSGYPQGLSGENIPVEARIMALADVFDALVSKRCYKDAYSFDKAFSIIDESLGSHFDPHLGKIFIDCRSELEKFYTSAGEA